MSSADWLRSVVEDARAVPGEQLGLREHSVSLLADSWTGAQPGEGTLTETRTPLLVGGQNPKVRWLALKEIAMGSLPDGMVEVGPLTPLHDGKGTDIAGLLGQALATGQTRFLWIQGPMLPQGARYRVIGVRGDRALRVTVQCVPAGV